MGELLGGGRAVAAAPERSEGSDRLPLLVVKGNGDASADELPILLRLLASVTVGGADRAGRLAARRTSYGLAHRLLGRADEALRLRLLGKLDGRRFRLTPQRDEHDDGERESDDHRAEGEADGYPGGAIVAEEQFILLSRWAVREDGATGQ